MEVNPRDSCKNEIRKDKVRINLETFAVADLNPRPGNLESFVRASAPQAHEKFQ